MDTHQWYEVYALYSTEIYCTYLIISLASHVIKSFSSFGFAVLLGRVCFVQHVDLSRCLLFVPRPAGDLSSFGSFNVWVSEFVLQRGLIILLQVKHSKVFTGFSLVKCRTIQIPCVHFPFIVVRLPYVMTSEFFAQEARAAGASGEMVWGQRVSRNMSSKLIHVGIVTLHVTLLVSDLWIKTWHINWRVWT